MKIEPLPRDFFMIYWIDQSRWPHGVSPYFGRRDKSGFFYHPNPKVISKSNPLNKFHKKTSVCRGSLRFLPGFPVDKPVQN